MSMTMEGLGAMAVGVLVLVVAFTIIPIVGNELDNSVTLPGCNDPVDTNDTCTYSGYAAGGKWNVTANSAIPTGVDLWESLGGILKVAGLIVVVAGFLRTLQGIRSGNG